MFGRKKKLTTVEQAHQDYIKLFEFYKTDRSKLVDLETGETYPMLIEDASYQILIADTLDASEANWNRHLALNAFAYWAVSLVKSGQVSADGEFPEVTGFTHGCERK